MVEIEKEEFTLWIVRWEYDRLSDEWIADAGAKTDPKIRAFLDDDDNWKHNRSEDEFISEEVAIHKALSIATKFENGVHEDFDRMRRIKNEKVSVFERVCRVEYFNDGQEKRSYTELLMKQIAVDPDSKPRPPGFYVN